MQELCDHIGVGIPEIGDVEEISQIHTLFQFVQTEGVPLYLPQRGVGDDQKEFLREQALVAKRFLGLHHIRAAEIVYVVNHAKGDIIRGGIHKPHQGVWVLCVKNREKLFFGIVAQSRADDADADDRVIVLHAKDLLQLLKAFVDDLGLL